jgi:Na+/H+-dicarboxylate symporter
MLATPTASFVPVRSPGALPAHLTFRGTRLLTGLILGFAGFVLIAFGGLAVPLSAELDGGAIDPGLMSTLLRIAPLVVVLGILHVIAGVGVARDRRWGQRLALWMVAFGTLATVAGIVVALAGRDPFAVANPAPGASRDGLGILLWTLAWYGIAAAGLQRIIAGRARR